MPTNSDRYREADVRRRLIVALDTSDQGEALALAERLRAEVAYAKIGLQLFTAAGPDVVRRVVSLGYEVFLDLKLHDIPNTMAGGVQSAAELGVRLMTVHALSGPGVGAAVQAADQAGPAGRANLPVGVLAVTVLTSHAQGELSDLVDSPASTSEMVERLGRQSVERGATGLVASPLEVETLRAALGPTPLLVIPGIRPAGAAGDDQARVATPAQALRAGADFLVVGRPITRAPDPVAAAASILDEMEGAR